MIEEHRARDTYLLQPVRIKTEDVESVKTFKYLGTVLDSNLSFTTHFDTVCKKVNQRMYLIRKIKTFDVDKKMLEMIYRSLVESILTFNLLRDMLIVMFIFLIQIHTFLLFNVLKREVSNVFLYIWTINYSYSYSYSYS